MEELDVKKIYEENRIKILDEVFLSYVEYLDELIENEEECLFLVEKDIKALDDIFFLRRMKGNFGSLCEVPIFVYLSRLKAPQVISYPLKKFSNEQFKEGSDSNNEIE